MKYPLVSRITLLAAFTASSPALLAHPGHTHTTDTLAGLIHALAGWPGALALLLVLVTGCSWRWRGSRRRIRP